MGVDIKTEFLKYRRHPRIAEKTEKTRVFALQGMFYTH